MVATIPIAVRLAATTLQYTYPSGSAATAGVVTVTAACASELIIRANPIAAPAEPVFLTVVPSIVSRLDPSSRGGGALEQARRQPGPRGGPPSQATDRTMEKEV